jgi:AcrR family transcriptional regulator
LTWPEQAFSLLNVYSAPDEDLTARATIRNAALRLFADRGPGAVTVREIAAEAGVSAGLVLHHFASKEGLRAAVDEYAARAFDAILEGLGGPDAPDLAAALTGSAPQSIAEAFARGFPAGSPLPDYLRRLLLSNDTAGAALFGRWFAATRALLDAMVDQGVARPGEDRAVRAAFLLVNDLALVLLRNQVAVVIGADPLTPEGISRWAREATAVYTEGAFRMPPTGADEGPEPEPGRG